MKTRNLLGSAFATCTAHDGADGATPAWFQTTPPYGDYPGGNITGKDGKPVENAVVRFDVASVKAVVDAFRARMTASDWPGVLVDREHFSLDLDKPSDAMAWAIDIRVADDGSIWTKWRFTPEGERLWKDRVHVCRSPVLKLDDGPDGVYRPTALQSIGMTNTPHFKELSTLAAAKAAAEETNTQGENQMDKEILDALGLAEGASKADVLAAIKAMKDEKAAAAQQATDAQKKADEAEAACRGLKADAFIAAHKDSITDAAKFREAYLKAPEATEAAFALYKTPAAKPSDTRIAARDAKTPDVTSGTGDSKAKIAARNKAVNEYMAAHKCSFQTAWSACRACDPETFAD